MAKAESARQEVRGPDAAVLASLTKWREEQAQHSRRLSEVRTRLEQTRDELGTRLEHQIGALGTRLERQEVSLRQEIREVRTTNQRQLWVLIAVVIVTMVGGMIKVVFFP